MALGFRGFSHSQLVPFNLGCSKPDMHVIRKLFILMIDRHGVYERKRRGDETSRKKEIEGQILPYLRVQSK